MPGQTQTGGHPELARTKLDYSNSLPVYIGKNSNFQASEDSADWTITKLTWVNGELTDIQKSVGSWTGRAALF